MRTPPSGLFGLLVAEFWERFSYFAVLSLLALNLNERLLLSEGQASTLAGSFAALSYLTPLFGGWLADRGLGAGRTILLGAICLLAGYLALMHASLAATYGAIGLLALGSGLFKPSFTTWLSSLAGDPASGQRQASFRWLFFCVNLAAAVAPLCIGGIQARRGFAAAFAFCALSMLLCLACIAALFLRSIRNGDMPKRAADEAKAGAGPRALAVLCLPSIAFFVVFSQSMGALVFWARDHIDRTLGGWLSAPIPPAMTLAVVPVLVLFLLPMQEPLRRRLIGQRVSHRPSTALAAALLFAVLSAGMLCLPELAQPHVTPHSAAWLLASYLFLTLGELLLVPLSLSLIDSLAPPRWRATSSGIYYLAIAAGSQLGSDLARLWGSLGPAAYFAVVALIPLIAMLLLLRFRRALDRPQQRC